MIGKALDRGHLPLDLRRLNAHDQPALVLLRRYGDTALQLYGLAEHAVGRWTAMSRRRAHFECGAAAGVFLTGGCLAAGGFLAFALSLLHSATFSSSKPIFFAVPGARHRAALNDVLPISRSVGTLRLS